MVGILATLACEVANAGGKCLTADRGPSSTKFILHSECNAAVCFPSFFSFHWENFHRQQDKVMDTMILLNRHVSYIDENFWGFFLNIFHCG